MSSENRLRLINFLKIYHDRIDIFIYPAGYGGEMLCNYIMANSKYDYYRSGFLGQFAKNNIKHLNRHQHNGSSFERLLIRQTHKYDILELDTNYINCNSFETFIDSWCSYYNANNIVDDDLMREVDLYIEVFEDSGSRLLLKTHHQAKYNNIFTDSIIFNEFIHQSSNFMCCDQRDIIYFNHLASVKLYNDHIIVAYCTKALKYIIKSEDKLKEICTAGVTHNELINIYKQPELILAQTKLKANSQLVQDKFHHNKHVYRNIFYIFALNDRHDYHTALTRWFNLNNIIIKKHDVIEFDPNIVSNYFLNND